MDITNKTENTEEKQKPAHWFKKGVSGNPNGRPKGHKNYSTLYREAIKNIAKLNNISPEEFEIQLVQKGITLARKGDYRFYKDVFDRLLGAPKQSVSLGLDDEVEAIKFEVIRNGNPSRNNSSSGKISPSE